ncbi:MAG: SpoIIE family protein phosphatase [Sphingobacteriaceae bacterium]|nr:SpoIIE family protein phosphatase [Sphingobacteriaceae bacterium]
MKKIYFYNLYRNIARMGLKRLADSYDKKHLLFINKMSMVNTLLMLAFSVTVLAFKLSTLFYIAVPFIFLFALPPFINALGLLHFCRYYFSILPLIFIACLSFHNSEELGDKYLILTTATIPLLLFKKRKEVIALFILNILFFFLIELYQANFSPLHEMPEFARKQYFIYGQFTVFAIIFSVIQHFKNNNEEYEQELELKNKLIHEKNHEIIDSITYAKRLQKAIMPRKKEITAKIPDNFILYKPKDIVAGDFYFAVQKNDQFIIAVADCTGHGVPGALVSMVCSNALHRAIEDMNLTEPGMILDKVRDLVIDSFNKNEFDVKDGMDISMATINTKTGDLAWAGANNPLWYIPTESIIELSDFSEYPISNEFKISKPLAHSGVKEIVANKQPVGKTDKKTRFTTHFLKLAKGSILYLFTDGFADQFGGPKGKKFMYKQLAELIFSIRHLSMREQREKLESVFDTWKGDQEQIDDVCIIGLKI